MTSWNTAAAVAPRVALKSVARALLGAFAMLTCCSTDNGMTSGSANVTDSGSSSGGGVTDSGGGSDGATDSGGAPLPTVPDNVAIAPAIACTMAGIGATKLVADAPVTILDVSSSSTNTVDGGVVDTGLPDKPYCLVKVKVDPQVNIWVAMPTMNWNGRLRAEGGGGYSGLLSVPTDSVVQDFVGVRTDTGHPSILPQGLFDGSFGMKSPGAPNTQLQIDFAYRSEHLMAVIGKQLAQAFYGQAPLRIYWFGCSTGGRQGLMMAQRYPEDFDAIVAGAPAIHWDRFQAYQIWPQVVMNMDLGAPITSASDGGLPGGKLALATQRAIASCDAADGVTDGLIDDPRNCHYDPRTDTSITTATCTAQDTSCLSPAEAGAIEKTWAGARAATGLLLWPGLERGADLNAMAGPTPFPIATGQPRYWVYLDPAWDWHTLNYQNYEAFFDKTVQVVGPLIATDNPDLSAFAARGGKLLLYHGWADQLIMSEGTTRYFETVVQLFGERVGQFAELFMVPGMAHCGGGPGPNVFGQAALTPGAPTDPDHNIFRALMAWSERGVSPQKIVATKYTADDPTQGIARTRPLCPYPMVARHTGSGSTDDAANFNCVAAQ